MSSGVETIEVVEPWLYARLSGDAALAALVGDNIVGTLSDGAVVPPYVVFSHVSSRDITGTGGVRTEVDCLYTVKAVARGSSWSVVRPIATRLGVLLGGADPTVVTTSTTPAGDLTCVREGIVQYPEVADGAQYRHLGATWRIRANSHA